MAGFLDLIDNKLGKDFNAPVYDPKKGRAKVVALIDKAAGQHKEGKTPPTRSWKLGNNNSIRFSPRLGSNPLLIAGSEDNFVPAERFQDFLAALKASVEAGELDKEIKAALDGQSDGTTKATKRGSKSSGDKPWAVRKDFDQLSVEDKRAVSSRYRWGKNPDNSLIEEVGHKPDAPIAAERKKA